MRPPWRRGIEDPGNADAPIAKAIRRVEMRFDPDFFLRSSRDIPREATALAALERDVRIRCGWSGVGVSLDRTRAGRTAQWCSSTVVGDEIQRLCWIVRRRTWLAHAASFLEGVLRLLLRIVTL